ncbi:hypothetical protein SK128_001348 [Halocaridina rubra]|uniref:Uncharacterized protein n=1 Tax=Halocaridina rubra TaxID=373956 RepID=A0AAN9AD48_HALRR
MIDSQWWPLTGETERFDNAREIGQLDGVGALLDLCKLEEEDEVFAINITVAAVAGLLVCVTLIRQVVGSKPALVLEREFTQGPSSSLAGSIIIRRVHYMEYDYIVCNVGMPIIL